MYYTLNKVNKTFRTWMIDHIKIHSIRLKNNTFSDVFSNKMMLRRCVWWWLVGVQDFGACWIRWHGGRVLFAVLQVHQAKTECSRCYTTNVDMFRLKIILFSKFCACTNNFLSAVFRRPVTLYFLLLSFCNLCIFKYTISLHKKNTLQHITHYRFYCQQLLMINN